MKVYLCVTGHYEGSDVIKVCKSKKKAERIASQVDRLLKVHKGLRSLDGELQREYWENNPQLIDLTRVENYFDSEEHHKIKKIEDKVDDLLQLFGASAFYRNCNVEERKLE